jgi:hypothetical protein
MRAERYLEGLVNGTRLGRARGTLHLDHAEGMACAREHAERMERRGELFHSKHACGGYAENVGVGPTVGSIHLAMYRSDPHRRNMLCDCARLAVGIVRSDDGGPWWVVEVFWR